MASLKNIVDLPVAESVENATLVVVEGGVAKQVPASEVGAQADWDEVDETSPAFIKNKPDLSSVGSGSGGGCYVYHLVSYNTVISEIASDEDMTDMQAYSNTFYERFMSGTIRMIFDYQETDGQKRVGTVVYYKSYTSETVIGVMDCSGTVVELYSNILPYDPAYSAS